MPIIYKLVGTKSSNRTELEHLDWDENNDELQQSDTHEFFKKLGCEDVEPIKFITDSETMIPDKKYKIKDNSRLVYVFTMDETVKLKLIELFNKYGRESEKANTQVTETKVDQHITKPIPEDEIKIDEKVIAQSNYEAIKLFQNENFKSLLKVYCEDSDVFKKFSAYISSGDVELTSFKSFDETKDFTNELQQIKNIDLDGYFSDKDEKILEALKKFNGHINLSLRYLLNNSC